MQISDFEVGKELFEKSKRETLRVKKKRGRN
jgi:hypothetical protein